MDELIQMLDETELTYSQLNFKEYKNAGLPDPPFILWTASPEKADGADDKMYLTRRTITVELYVKKLGTEHETNLTAAMRANGIDYEKTEDYDSNEKVYVVKWVWENTEKIRRI